MNVDSMIKNQIERTGCRYRKDGTAWTFIVNGKREGNEICFMCPFCFKSYKKNGLPRSNTKRLMHRHGLDHNLQTGECINVSNHCNPQTKKLFNLDYFHFEIYDNDELPDNEENPNFILHF